MPDLRVFLILSLLAVAARAQSLQKNVLELKPFVVTGTRPSAADTAAQDGIKTYDSSDIDNSGAFSVDEFIETLPTGAAGRGQQLVLIDGVPAYLDLSALSPAMIEGIDVSNSGGMPQLGAYATGRVINIRLKKDYDGRQLAFETGASLHGDAWNREMMLSGASFRGKFKALYSVRYSSRDAVTADERDFSRGQDNRSRGGRDFRLPWGDLPVVQAVSGNLSGITDANGQPVATALVPEDGALTPGDFLPGSSPSASGQRFFNTSPYLYLASPSERVAANLSLTYTTANKVNLSLSANYRTSNSARDGPPPVTPASADTLVPAAFNPFGQDVQVGLVHAGFGPVVQRSDDSNARVNFGANGELPRDWKWSAQASYSRNHTNRDTRDLDPDQFAAALTAADPLVRFNPFAIEDARNATLYPTLAVHRTQETRTDGAQFNVRSHGPVGKGWGAGPVQLSLGASANARREERTSRSLRGVADADTATDDSNYSLFSSAEIPLVEKKPGLRRLSSRFSTGYSATSAGGATERGDAGVSWAPVQSLLFRVGYGGSRTSPGDFNDDDNSESSVESLVDPRRSPAIAENVQVTARRAASTETQRRRRLSLSATYEPVFLKGFQVTVSHQTQRQDQASDSPFDPQDVIDNEDLLAGRVVRADPTALDLALGQPGMILAVDTTSAPVARRSRQSLDLDIEYRLPEQPWGRLSFDAGAGWVLANRYEFANGQAFQSNESESANPPDWNGHARAQWRRKSWNANFQVRYVAATASGTTPARSDMSLGAGYRFTKPLWRDFGKGLQVRLSAQNLGANTPPYADTLLGYRGGSALGTMLSFSAQLPL